MPLVTQACPASSHSGGHVGVSGHAPICTCCAIETELMNTIVVKPMRKGNGVQTGYPEPVRREPRSSSRGTLPVPRPLPQGLLWTVGCTRPLPGFGTTCSMALGSLLTAEPPLHSQIHLLTLRTFHWELASPSNEKLQTVELSDKPPCQSVRSTPATNQHRAQILLGAWYKL